MNAVRHSLFWAALVGLAACSVPPPTRAWIEAAPAPEREKIEQQLRLALVESPQQPELSARLARVLLLKGEPAEAEIVALAAASRAPFDGEISEVLGEIFLRQNKRFRALTAFSRAVQFEPELLSAYVGLARTHHLLGKTADALAALEQALQREPRYFPARHQRARILFEAGRKEEAAEALRAAGLIRPGHPDLLLLEVRMKKAEGKFSAARMLAEEALRVRPKFPEVLAELLEIHYQRREWKKALAVLEQLGRMRRRAPGPSLIRVEILAAQGREEAADRLLDAVIGRYPGNVAARVVKGKRLIAQGKPREALQPLKMAVETDPGGRGGFFWKAVAHYGLGQAAQGDAALAAAARLDPKHQGTLLLLARRRMAAADWERAGEIVQALLEQRPGDEAAIITWGELLTLKGNLDGARERLALLPRSGPGKPLRFARARLAHLRGEPRGVLEHTRPLLGSPPVPWQVVYLHAAALGRLKKGKEALEFLGPYLRRRAGKGALHRLAGDLHYLRGERDRAAQVFETGLAAFPRHAALIDAATRLAVEEGRYEQARQRLEGVIEKPGPLRPLFLERLSRVYRQLKEMPDARKYLERYLAEADPLKGPGADLRARPPLAESPYPLAGFAALSTQQLLQGQR